jgi:carboxymethylenebutenolidase
MQITVPDGSFAAYVAHPAVLPAPAIVVLQEIFGVNRDIRATCDELAAQGFIAIAPDLFWRLAPGLDLNAFSPEDWKRGLALRHDFDMDRGLADIAATMQSARQAAGSTGKVGVIGFCLGGLLAYLTAARLSADAAVSYYGGSTEMYLEDAATLTAPVIMHLGEADEYIPPAVQQTLLAAFANMPNVTIFRYPGCSHAFARHSGAHFDANATTQANARTLAFFRRHLAGS